MKVDVLVPATSANLGPGFDVFGLAVNFHNRFSVAYADTFEIYLKNKKQKLTVNEENLFYQAFVYLFKKAGKEVPKVKITMDLQIPLGRGFGSSATAVVGGLVAANTFLQNRFSNDELLPFAIELERGKHPDNVTPALLGGLIVATTHDSKVVHTKVPFPEDIKAVFFIPDFVMDTVIGRKLMPSHYRKQDVVFNTSRVALFLASLQTGQYDLLKIAMQDKVHQPIRTNIFPLMPKLISTAIDAGALGAALSGGGSSIIALANNNFERIGLAMQKKAKEADINGTFSVFTITNEGVKVHVSYDYVPQYSKK